MAFLKVGAVIAALVLGWSAVRAQPSTLPSSPVSTESYAGGGSG